VKFVVTAGPTREPIDPVRFISNRSSGKMGYAIAEAALEAGHEVTLISGPTALAAPKNARVTKTTTADELYEAVRRETVNCDVLVMCAAVSDYKPIEAVAQKMPKQRGEFSLRLISTRDILASLPHERSYLVIGFAAETHDMETSAQKKLREKNCDAIVANDVSANDVGMESDENAVEIFFQNCERKKISRAKKLFIARELIKIIFEMRGKRLTKKT
jgi:phosphopantothenoylcysteine decarboxylase/phosphopantothenate--cysteine ligase